MGFWLPEAWSAQGRWLSFLGNRFIRIYPALAVEVFLSAFLLGAVFTSLDLSLYFADPEFLRYLVNVTGHIHFSLPVSS